MIQCDVLVVGLGPGGTAAALTLARARLDVLVVTRARRDYHGFVETLGPAAVAELTGLGFSERDIAAFGCASYGMRAAWGSPRPHFHSHILDPPAMHGWHVDRDSFDRLLARRAETAGVRVVDGFRLARIGTTAGGWSIADGGGRPPVRCRFLVDASGRAAVVSRALGIRPRTLDRACAAYAVTNGSADVLSVSSARYGWWYSTPVVGTHAITAVVSDGDILRDLGAVRSRTWSALAARAGIDASLLHGGVRTCSCATAFLEPCGGARWLAVGDAALCSDPLDGHGIHRALRSGRLAGEAIVNAFRGSRGALRAFRTTQSSEASAFVELQRRQYEMERRWPQDPFWSRRLGSAGLRRFSSFPSAGARGSLR